MILFCCMNNKHNNTITRIFQSISVLLVISFLCITSLLAYAQEGTPPDRKLEDSPYELGVVLVQYEEELFQAQVNDEAGGGAVQIPGGLLDGIDGGTAPVAVVDEFLTEKGFESKVIERFPGLHAEAIRIGEDVDPLSVMDSLIELPGVVLVQPNFLYEPTQAPQAPNDPLLSTSWHLLHTQVYSADPSQTTTAWKAIDGLATASYVPTIAVIDTGIDTDHPEFKDVSANSGSPQFNRLPNLTNCKVPIFSSAVELDRVRSVTTTCPVGGYDFIANDNNPSHPLPSENPHGTAVASVAAANRNNGNGGAGVAYFANIMPLKNNFSTISILKSVAFARLNGADIINASFGGFHAGSDCTAVYRSSPSPSYRYLLEAQQIRNFPGLFVVSAGNENLKTGNGEILFALPADFSKDMSAHGCWGAVPNVISVGGTENSADVSGDDAVDTVETALVAAQGIEEVRWRSPFVIVGSNYHADIDIAAPSTNIEISTLASTGTPRNRINTRAAGTSFSAPQVAGTLALMLRANSALTPAQLKQRLLESADELVSLAGPDCTAGTADDYVHRGRRLNAYNAVRAALGLPYTKKEVSNLTPTQRATCLRGGKDADGDGFIDITTIEELSNMRYNLAGTSYKTGPNATGVTTGCPATGCVGYELVNTLDFVGTSWETSGWTPIDAFTGTFEGNGHAIYNLPSTSAAASGDRLFGTFQAGGQLRNLEFIHDSYWGCDAKTVSRCSLPAADHNQTLPGSCPVGDAGTCSYLCGRGDWHEVTNTCAQPPQVSCVTDLSTLTNNATTSRNASWVAACASINRLGRYGKYYTFTLNARSKVVIDLISPRNPFLYLNAHDAAHRYKSGAIITRNKSGGRGSRSRITSILPAGTYTIEATTSRAGKVGSFDLRVHVADPPVGACPAVNRSWTVQGTTCSANLTAVPHGESLGVNDATAPTIGSALFRCRASGKWKKIGNPRCASFTCPAVNRTWTVNGNTCASTLPATDAGSQQTVADQTGSATGSATYACTIYGSAAYWTAAKNATCTSTVATCPAATQTWTVNNNVCSGSIHATTTGNTRHAHDRSGATVGIAAYACDANGRWVLGSNPTCATP